MFRNRSVNLHDFAMVPRADIPRSSFRMQKAYKTTFNAAELIPVFCEEVLPGDTWNCNMTAFARMATPLFPIMDNIYLESFWFYVPNRLVWTNWVRMMGERDNPDDSISFTIPQIVSPVGGYDHNTVYDFLGLPIAGQVDPAATITHSALPLRGLAMIHDEWFRDENLLDATPFDTDDGPDDYTQYAVYRRGKRHDYFTSCLPFLQKGASVPLPLGTTAPVYGTGQDLYPAFPIGVEEYTGAAVTPNQLAVTVGNTDINLLTASSATGSLVFTEARQPLYADLSAATAATINQLRQSFQIQRLLERDARGGTRYTELLRAHFGVNSPDSRLQRPEYLGGGRTPVAINPIAQTSATTAAGTDTPQGNLSAMGTALMPGHGFTHSFVEHGYVFCLVNVRADLTYQQGLRRHWSRLTRYDYYWPAFAMLGEQAVLSKELYCDGTADDNDVFGYQERWAEYRYLCSEITGAFRSRHPTTLDAWHLSQNFEERPLLNSDFITEYLDGTMERVIAVGADAGGAQFLFDAFFDVKAARPMPLYSVPGMIDHF